MMIHECSYECNEQTLHSTTTLLRQRRLPYLAMPSRDGYKLLLNTLVLVLQTVLNLKVCHPIVFSPDHSA